MRILKEGEDGFYAVSTKEISDYKKIRALGSVLSQRIMKELSKRPMYPLELAKTLGVHEQKVYYHIRNLESAGYIRKVKQEARQGLLLNYYGLMKPSFFVNFGSFEPLQKLSLFASRQRKFLSPFVEEGRLNAVVVIGSPEPHGPEKAKARDSICGMEFTLFLGTHLDHLPSMSVKLDTETTAQDMRNNMLILGGPVVNKVCNAVNHALPIFFDKKNKWSIRSKLSGKLYTEDNCGLIVKTKNPFDRDRYLLVIGGKRFAGTRAATIAFLNFFDRLLKGNKYDSSVFANVVEGIDANSDGIIDSVEFLE